MRELIVIRTHFYCEATDRLYKYLKETSKRDVVLICDETHGTIDVGPGKAKLSISENSAKEMGLHVPKKFGWLCGDYSLYAAAELLSAYDRYWLVESDVRISFDMSAQFFDSFFCDSTDFLAFHIFKAQDNWFWYKPMCYFEREVYACLFPVVGISRSAIRFAFERRKEMSACFEAVVPRDEVRRWPNDESFLTSTLMNNGFKCQNLDAGESKFRINGSFNVGLPKSDKRIRGQSPTGLLYHPVHAGHRFVEKAHAWLSSYTYDNFTKAQLERAFNSEFLADLRLEAAEEEYLAFDLRLRAATEKANAE